MGANRKGPYEEEVFAEAEQVIRKPKKKHRKPSVESLFPVNHVPDGYKNTPKPLSKKQKAKRK